MRLKRLSASIAIVLASLLSAQRSVGSQPSPGVISQSHREVTLGQNSNADEAKSPDQQRSASNTLADPTPPRVTRGGGTSEGGREATEVERHDLREETLENQLVRLTAVLAGIEIITLVFFFFSMRANIKAANAAKTAADA